ncbi:MAG TPA: zinc-dependent metalloprotease [Thermomicrobiales bacterium]
MNTERRFQGARSAFPIDRRLIAMGLLAGAAVGAWASGRVREWSARSATAPGGLIDWDQARGIAINMNRGLTLTAVERDRLDRYYRDLVRRCVPIVSEYTGIQLPETTERTFAFDRVDWINANIDAFKTMLAPLEALNPTPSSRSVAAALWGGINRTIITAELGLLLGYLARRVLGQYDLALLGREPITNGKLYFVEPNIQGVERMLGLPSDEFRMWLALHETTHAFEFEGHPWVRSYFNQLLESYFAFLREDAEQLKQGMRGLKILVDRVRTGAGEGESWIEALMTPEQRALFSKMQALMCVIEGYSNHVMNAVGQQLLREYETIATKFEARQRQRTMAEQLFARLTGLDVKLEQYRIGQKFIDTIVERRGHDVARRVWDGPENLPTMEELRQPDHWLARVVGG